jgi:chemotaxis protein histidine kinase CheA
MTSVAQAEQLQSGIERIRQRFLQGLDARAEQIFELLNKLGNAESDREACMEIHAIVHKLHGTAKTVGFPTIGTMSAEFEHYINDLLAKPGTPDTVVVQVLLDELLDEIEALLRGE